MDLYRDRMFLENRCFNCKYFQEKENGFGTCHKKESAISIMDFLKGSFNWPNFYDPIYIEGCDSFAPKEFKPMKDLSEIIVNLEHEHKKILRKIDFFQKVGQIDLSLELESRYRTLLKEMDLIDFSKYNLYLEKFINL
jgi:hypothetical protein